MIITDFENRRLSVANGNWELPLLEPEATGRNVARIQSLYLK